MGSEMCIRDRTITHRCQQNLPPPGTAGDSVYHQTKEYYVKINKHDFSYEDCAFGVIVFEDSNGILVYHDTITKEEIKTLRSLNEPYITVVRQLTGQAPSRYLIWSYSASHGWGDKVVSYF